MKQITIVVPLYNKVKYIGKCLDSIKEAIKNVDAECIVVDDGSTDGSSEVAVDFCNAFCDKFTYIKCLRNHGLYPSYARNLGIRMAESKYMMFFDADDVLCDDYVERGIQWMEEHPDFSLYGEGFYLVESEDENNWYFREFYPYYGVSPIDYISYINIGGGTYTRGIFKTEEVKKVRFKDVMLEDSIFILDYLYPFKKYYMNANKQSFWYFVCRSEQDVFAYDKIKKELGVDDRTYIKNYVKETYPDFYNTYYDRIKE